MRYAAVFAVCAVLLAGIALASPAPDRVTDRDVYEATAARGIVPDCGDLHCFRVLVPWVLGPLPGASIVKWKAYAVVCNAATAVAVFVWCLALGLPRRAVWMASMASAFGFGSLYTLHDPYTSDPLMYLLGPFISSEALNGRTAVAAAVAAVGVFAKEFAGAPLYIVAAWQAVERRWGLALRTLAGANVAFLAWLLLTLTLMLRFNYSYSGSASADLGHGANLVGWLSRQSPRGVVSAMFIEFGALWLLMPIGFFLASRQLRLLVLVALPVAALFGYVQQPDRALWNFHFLATPLAATVLDRAPATLAAATLAAFVVANLRVGAQLPMAFVGRTALAASVMLAAASAWTALRTVRS
jgi:hypothetical protein